MAKVVLTKEFFSYLRDIIDYETVYRDESSMQLLVDKILNTISLLENFPLFGHLMYEDEKGKIYRIIKDRYNIYYTYESDTVTVLNIQDARKITKIIN